MILVDRSRAKWRNTRLACRCGGYHFPHRRTGGACDHGPRRDYYQALRHGCTEDEALSYLDAEVRERMLRWFEKFGGRPRVRDTDRVWSEAGLGEAVAA